MQPLARHYARMERRIAYTRRWFWRERTGGVSWGLRIQRAGCSRRFRAAAPCARAGGQGSLTGEEGGSPCRAQPQLQTSNSSLKTPAEEAAERPRQVEMMAAMMVTTAGTVSGPHLRDATPRELRSLSCPF